MAGFEASDLLQLFESVRIELTTAMPGAYAIPA
jgi:hypothetical protein